MTGLGASRSGLIIRSVAGVIPRCPTTIRSTLRRHIIHGRTFSSTSATRDGGKLSPVQSYSSMAPLGVSAALQASSDPSLVPRPKIFDEFSLQDRVGIVSGGNRGLGLEMALALCEAGARAVYCVDLPAKASEEWESTREYIRRMGNGSRLEYICADVTDQKGIWGKVAEVGEMEGRVDVCIAAAGILKAHTDCLEYPAEQFREVRRCYNIWSSCVNHALLLCGLGAGREYEWRFVHCASRREADGKVW